MTNLVKLLDRSISYHRCFAAISGSVTSGVLLSQCVFWSNRTSDPDGWFYKTQDEWYEETYLSRKEQESARARLRSIGVLEEKKEGVPCQLFYRLNIERLNELLQEYANFGEVPNKKGLKGQTSMPETDKPVCPDRTSQYAQKGHTRVPEMGIHSLYIDDYIDDSIDDNKEGVAIQVAKKSRLDPFWQQVVDLYNANKPDLWARLLVLNEARLKALRRYRKELGDPGLLAAIGSACKFAEQDTWWGSKGGDLDKLLRDNRLVSFAESYQAVIDGGGIHKVLEDPKQRESLQRRQRIADSYPRALSFFGNSTPPEDE